MGFPEDDGWAEPDRDYEVGYRKPPRHSRFKPGHSGNRRGRPLGVKNSATLLKRALLEPVLVKQRGNQVRTIKLRVIVTQLVNQAVGGDYASIRLLFRYAGLDRRLSQPTCERPGLSEAAENLIRRALMGEECSPQTSAAAESGNEVPSSAGDVGEVRASSEVKRDEVQRVGYGRPPVHTRFQKGRSGNPAGRPRARKGFRPLILKMLEEEVGVTENGRKRIVSKLQLILTQIVNKAAGGDLRFQALLLEFAPALDVELRPRCALPENALEIIRRIEV